MANKEDRKLRTISELGEFGLIKHLTKNVTTNHPFTIKGVGDDAAVVDYQPYCQVVTSDLLIEGIHFNLIYTPLKHLGYKAVVVNLSDIYAMNAEPVHILVNIALSSKFSLQAVEEIYEGISLACKNYHVELIGGDTSSSLTGLMISVTAIGKAEKSSLVYRSTAKKNDIICVSGDLGAAYMGLQLLEREKAVFADNPTVQPDLSEYAYIIGRQLKPEARADVIVWLKEKNIVPHAMIDISDGLSSELLHICSSSGMGCKVFEDKIPLHANTKKMAEEMHIEPIIAALNGGEDYELLFTVDIYDYDKIKDAPGIHAIGHITEDKQCVLVTGGGNFISLQAQGWNAFSDK